MRCRWHSYAAGGDNFHVHEFMVNEEMQAFEHTSAPLTMQISGQNKEKEF